MSALGVSQIGSNGRGPGESSYLMHTHNLGGYGASSMSRDSNCQSEIRSIRVPELIDMATNRYHQPLYGRAFTRNNSTSNICPRWSLYRLHPTEIATGSSGDDPVSDRVFENCLVQAKDHPITTTVGAAESPCVLRRDQNCSLCDGRELPKLSRHTTDEVAVRPFYLGVFS